MEKDTWSVEIWGCRGSYPRAEARFLKYGGNTSCVSLDFGEGVVILDAGSGLMELGRRLAGRDDVTRGSVRRREDFAQNHTQGHPLTHALAGRADASRPSRYRRLDILISHLHLDHVQGLPMFGSFYDSEMEIHIYGQIGLRQALETLVGPPYWPVGFQDFAAKISFHELRPGEAFSLKGLKVTTMAGNHPGGSILYRIDGMSADGIKKSLVYALDCEMDEKMMRGLKGFAEKTDLLLWDAGFAAEDLKPGWGHSTWEQGMELRCLVQAKKVVVMHYNGEYDDAFLQELEERAKKQDAAVLFAREGMKLC